jgi:hypothetical protein
MLEALPMPLGSESTLGLAGPNGTPLTGAVAGLLSSGLAATLYASNCTDDSPLFVMTWYSVAITVVASIGALAGSKLLRF